MILHFHKLYRDQHTRELREMQPAVLATLRERERARDMQRLRVAMARQAREAQ